MSQGWGQPPQAPGPYGQPPTGFGPQPQQASASGMAVAALVLGIMAWVAGGFIAAIPGMIIGKMELNKINRGESPEAGRSFAMIGYWASLANIIFTVVIFAFICVVWIVMFGAMAATVPAQQY
jgi:hypothetical protein